MQKLVNIILFCFFLSGNLLFSQIDTNKYFVQIQNITLNGIAVSDIDNIIAISKEDSLSINYRLVAPANSPQDDFFYKIVFTNGFDSAVHTTGFNSLNYKNLQNGKYLIYISAFALKENWKTEPKIIKIVVDDSLAKIAKEANILKKNLSKSLTQNNANINNEHSNSLISSNYLIYGIIILILIILGIIFALIKKNKSKNTQNNRNEEIMEKQEIKNTDGNSSALLEENNKLKAEISELRTQIDTANIRASQLSTQNKELESKIESLIKTQESLEELSQQKDELFALIIHDIKNPAAIIKNLVDLLRSYDLTANEQIDIIQDIAETSQRILDLSLEVTLVLSIESGKMAMNFEKNAINNLIKDVVSKNQVIAKKKNIKLFEELPDNLPEVEMDYRRIREAIDNLISNAIKFTEENGTVRVRAFKEAGNITVEVSDNGLGLSEEDVEKAFRWGQTLSSTPTAGEPSSGLGLWIVKKIIDSHNGRVWIKSALGKGSTFAFSFPLKQDPQQ
ncbi:MAG: ATP-binding protein [Chloroherpetonaceae bacterium]